MEENENGNDHATMLSKQELRAKKKRTCVIYRYIHESWGFRLTNLFFRGRIGLWVIRRWLSNFCFSADLTFKFGSEAEIKTTDQSHAHTQPQIKHRATNDGSVQRYDVTGDLRVHFATENQQIWGLLREYLSMVYLDFLAVFFIVPNFFSRYISTPNNIFAKNCFILITYS